MTTELNQIQDLMAQFRRPCPPGVEYQDRLIEEFGIIIDQRFTEYFLKIRRILDLNQDIPHMTRGSAGSSLICYLMGITDVDLIIDRPIKYHSSSVIVGQGEIRSKDGSQFLQVNRGNVSAMNINDYFKLS